MTGYILLAASVLTGACGQVLFKIGVEKITEEGFGFYLAMVKNLWIYGGFTLYGFSFIMWMKVLTYFELSFARPITSIGYIITYLLAILFLGEVFTIKRMMGILLITLGVVLLK